VVQSAAMLPARRAPGFAVFEPGFLRAEMSQAGARSLYMNDDVAGQDRQRRCAALCEPLRADLFRFAFWLSRDQAPAASLVAGVLVAATLWISWPPPTLAAEVIGHALHEPAAWTMDRELAPEAVAEVLDPSRCSRPLCCPHRMAASRWSGAT